jgi:hypothetical protein
MVEETRGRPSKADTRANTVVQRVQSAMQARESASHRPLPYGERLFLERKITPSQFAAIDQIAKLYRQWSKQNGARFNPKSQSFEFTTAGEVGPPSSPRREEQERIKDVNEAWHRLEKCVPVYPREAWAWVFELAVHGMRRAVERAARHQGGARPCGGGVRADGGARRGADPGAGAAPARAALSGPQYRPSYQRSSRRWRSRAAPGASASTAATTRRAPTTPSRSGPPI